MYSKKILKIKISVYAINLKYLKVSLGQGWALEKSLGATKFARGPLYIYFNLYYNAYIYINIFLYAIAGRNWASNPLVPTPALGGLYFLY